MQRVSQCLASFLQHQLALSPVCELRSGTNSLALASVVPAAVSLATEEEPGKIVVVRKPRGPPRRGRPTKPVGFVQICSLLQSRETAVETFEEPTVEPLKVESIPESATPVEPEILKPEKETAEEAQTPAAAAPAPAEGNPCFSCLKMRRSCRSYQ